MDILEKVKSVQNINKKVVYDKEIQIRYEALKRNDHFLEPFLSLFD